MQLPVAEVQAKSGPISESEKFRQHLFFPLYHHFQLQLECFGGLFLDLFDALNLPAASICQWDCQLLKYKQNRRPISESEKFRQQVFFLLYHHFQLELECLGGLFLDLFDTLNPPVESICPCDYRLLRYRQNRVQFLRREKFRQHLFFLLYHHFQLQLERLGGLFLDLFDALNPPVESICRWDSRLLRYRQNRVRVKNSASSCFPHCTNTFN